MGGVDAVAQKRGLRKRLIAERDLITQDERSLAAWQTAERLASSGLLEPGRTLMLFASIGSEMPTAWLHQLALDLRMQMAYPRVIKAEHRIEAALVADFGQMQPGVMGILEPPRSLNAVDPLELDVIIVPGLGFDRQGYRLGYGGGYYDRFLPTAVRALRIGLTFSQGLITKLPAEPHDQRMHWILTEQTLFAPALE